jgi:mRNA interferase MazF
VPARGEIWLANFSPTKGHEQAGTRPALVVSANALNNGPAELVVVLPLTTRDRRVPLHVPIEPPNGGVTELSFIMCEMIRSISTGRLIRLLGTVDQPAMRVVEDRLRILQDL